MNVKPQVCVVGLGNFGYKFGEALINMGHNVIGIDKRQEHIKKAQHIFSQVFEADALQKEALKQIGVADMSHILVSVGDSIAASSMITMHLKELKVKNVWARAVNEDHAKLLSKIGADEVIIPEYIAAEQIADRIDIPGIIQRLPFDSDMIIQKLTIDKLNEKTLIDIDLTNKFNAQVIAVKQAGENNYRYIPKAYDKLFKGDIIIVIGDEKSLSKIEP